ncbi:VOC family protein [Nocardia farcinica]|uniref:VOC family protein n=1 Tax=Nocardia farcinica TaxID=37329 RepID=UPI0024567FBA|nr:VOC family protein [Nocardia farcinica]
MTSITPYVMVDRAHDYRAFLEHALDAEVSTVVALPTDESRVVHAEARIGDSVLFFADSGAEGQRCLSSPTEPVHVQLWATVPDADTVFARAVEAGARPAQEITAQPNGSRMGGFVDPFGTLWWISTTAPAAV